MKIKITKEEYEKLSDEIKNEYSEKDGSFVLSLDDLEDTGALKRAKDHEKAERKRIEAELNELKAKTSSENEEVVRKKGDVDALDKSWKTKYEALATEKDASINKYLGFLKKNLVEKVALDLATSLSPTNSKVLIPHIEKRLSVDLEGDEPSTKILGIDGKISAFTLEDLKKEFVNNNDFSGVITATNASGSGTPNNSNNNSNNNGGYNRQQQIGDDDELERELAAQFH